MDQNEERIVKLCKKNNREGYRLLYDHYHRFVYTLCFRSTYNNEDALDLVQEVFIKIFKGMEGFDQKKPLLPWIKRITVNTLINYSGRRPDEITVDITEESSKALFGESKDEDRPEERATLIETRGAIESCISQLPGNERTVIILRHFEEKSYEEIARVMNCPLGTIKTYLYRGRKLLREQLKCKGIWEV